MNYKLAKELAEAGFPMPKRGNLLQNPDCNGCSEQYANAHKAKSNCLLFEPTLSELIEACSSVIFLIYCYPKGHNGDITNKTWFVVKRPGLMDMERCSTSEEAVARLWMKLVDCEPKKK